MNNILSDTYEENMGVAQFCGPDPTANNYAVSKEELANTKFPRLYYQGNYICILYVRMKWISLFHC